tara:strand:- start:116 stop:229 length:114 start_codon:yes stop_codon:yes gene_type:complete
MKLDLSVPLEQIAQQANAQQQPVETAAQDKALEQQDP